MSSNNGYIYVRRHPYYDIDKVCKLGRATNIPDRDNGYATGEYRRGKFGLVIEIEANQEYNDIYVEQLLENYFQNYHSKEDGGSEFYNIKIIDEIETFLCMTKIKFRVLNEEDINGLIRVEREKNKNVIKKEKKTKVPRDYQIDTMIIKLIL